MNGLEIIIVFLCGAITGVSALITLIMVVGARALKRKGDQLSKQKASITDRMKRVKEITNEQVDLAMKAEEPQKNSLDGKYKNSLVSRLKALDEEKNQILISILDDGYDPELTTMDSSGTVTQMKLSEYMAHMGIAVKSKPKASKPASKFTVFRGGKDDGSGGDSNTTH